MSRLRSSTAKHERQVDVQPLDQLFTRKFDRASDLKVCVERTIKYWTDTGKRRAPLWRAAQSRSVCGVEHRLKQAMTRSDALIEEAIAADPRLANKPSWIRSEIGEFAEPTLVACGDDQPCFSRSRRNFSHSPATGTPIRVVISTDANKVEHDTPAAFIAVARLVMQFRPLEIWWQGAWLLNGCDSWAPKGFVFHVPLLANDTDFSRLEFCIADNERDNLSYCVGITMALENKRLFRDVAGQAEKSFLEGTDQFVNHKGISPSGTTVAYEAARWLGLEDLFTVRWNESKDASAALQKMPDPAVAPKVQTEEERKRQTEWWKRYQSEAEQRKREAEEERQKAVTV